MCKGPVARRNVGVRGAETEARVSGGSEEILRKKRLEKGGALHSGTWGLW